MRFLFPALAVAGLSLVLIALFFDFQSPQPIFARPPLGQWDPNPPGNATMLIDLGLLLSGLVALLIAVIGLWRRPHS